MNNGRRHPKWKHIQPPDALLYLLEWFYQIAHGRPVAMGALLPIPNAEILAWSTLTRTPLRLWEVETIRRLDAAFLTAIQGDGATWDD